MSVANVSRAGLPSSWIRRSFRARSKAGIDVFVPKTAPALAASSAAVCGNPSQWFTPSISSFEAANPGTSTIGRSV